MDYHEQRMASRYADDNVQALRYSMTNWYVDDDDVMTSDDVTNDVTNGVIVVDRRIHCRSNSLLHKYERLGANTTVVFLERIVMVVQQNIQA
jgi:hypothetical protein